MTKNGTSNVVSHHIEKMKFGKLGVFPFAVFLPAICDGLTYCWTRVQAVYDNIHDTCHMQRHNKRTEEKKPLQTLKEIGNFTKNNNNSKINRNYKIPFDSIWLIMISILTFLPGADGAGGAAAAAAFTCHSVTVIPESLSTPLAMPSTRHIRPQPIVSEKASQARRRRRQIVNRGHDLCSVEVDNGHIVFKVSSKDGTSDILNFKVDKHYVADCVTRTEEAVIDEKFQKQFNISFVDGQCIFIIFSLNGSQSIVSISSEAKALAEVSINEEDQQRCKDPSNRSFILKS
ncbi:hypothetical protein MAR_002949, partial [Mya arenaria]